MPTFAVILLTAPPPGFNDVSAFGRIDGKEAVLRSVELFLSRDEVKQVQIVMPADSLEENKKKFGAHLTLYGVRVTGAAPRWIDQLIAAAAKVSEDVSHVIVHDAARCVIPYSDIDALLETAETKPAVALHVPMRGAIVEVDEGDAPIAVHTDNRFGTLLATSIYSRAAYLDLVAKKALPHVSTLSLVKASPLNTRLGGGNDGAFCASMMKLLPKPKIKMADNPFQEAQW